MNDLDWQEPNETACPKRVWVMSTLSDDEALDEAGSPSQALAFHLSRCDSCRALADRLGRVSSRLRDLSALEPDGKLADRAHDQAVTALREGARLTGRVRIPEELERATVAAYSGRWLRRARYAAAAVIVVAVGLYGVLRSSDVSVPQGPVPLRVTRGPALRADHPNGSKLASNDVRSLVGVDPPGAPVVVPPRDREEEAPPAAAPQLAASTVNPDGPPDDSAVSPPAGRATRRICRHRTRLEAAMCDNTHSVHTAIVLPLRARRTLGTPRRPIDKPPSRVSTRPPPGG